MTDEATPAASRVTAVRLLRQTDSMGLQREVGVLDWYNWKPERPFVAGQSAEPISPYWRCLPLRSPGGSLSRTDPGGPATEAFADTVALHACPLLAGVLAELPGERRSARLLALDPGGYVDEHRDDFIGLRYGQVRLHIPIITDPGASITIERERHVWQPGSIWYGDFGLPHTVEHSGSRVRIHLVVDLLIDERFAGWFQPDLWSRISADGVLFNRTKTTSDPPDVSSMGAFRIPASLRDPLGDPVDRTGYVSAWLESGDEGLIWTVDGQATCLLEPIGDSEFRFSGWGDERTMRFYNRYVELIVRRGHSASTYAFPSL